MRYVLSNEIEIPAPPQQVWATLIDLPAYEQWNPGITHLAGEPLVGRQLTLRLRLPGRKPMTMRPRVTEVAPGRVFEWLGKLWGIPGLFDGRHRFELVATADGTRLVQSESFSGLLVRPLRSMIDGATRQGFVEVNQALSARVTGQSQAA
jgi:hypothetical protein